MNSGKLAKSFFMACVLDRVSSICRLSGIIAYDLSVESGITLSQTVYVRLVGLTATYSALIYFDSYIGASNSIGGNSSTLFNTGIRLLTTTSLLYAISIVIYSFCCIPILRDFLADYTFIERKVLCGNRNTIDDYNKMIAILSFHFR